MNLHGTVSELGSDGGVTLALAGPGEETVFALNGADRAPPVGSPVEISIRPENIEAYGAAPSGVRNVVMGEVEELLFTGENFEARILLGGESVALELPSGGSFAEGQVVCLQLQEDAITLWPVDGEGP